MRSPTYLLAFALGLVPSLTVASKCGDNVAIERLPVDSSSDGPFIVRAQDGYNLFLKEDKERGVHVPVLSKKDDGLPEFLLERGNFTTADKSLAAVYGPVPPIYPPVLLRLVFTDKAEGQNGAEVVFVTKTRSDGSGREVRRLFFLDGRELASRPFLKGKAGRYEIQKLIWTLIAPVVRHLAEGAEVFVKPQGNVGKYIPLLLPSVGKT